MRGVVVGLLPDKELEIQYVLHIVEQRTSRVLELRELVSSFEALDFVDVVELALIVFNNPLFELVCPSEQDQLETSSQLVNSFQKTVVQVHLKRPGSVVLEVDCLGQLPQVLDFVLLEKQEVLEDAFRAEIFLAVLVEAHELDVLLVELAEEGVIGGKLRFLLGIHHSVALPDVNQLGKVRRRDILIDFLPLRILVPGGHH